MQTASTTETTPALASSAVCELQSSICNDSMLVPLPEALPQSALASGAEKHTYGQILKSSALVGGSSVLNIAIGIVRTKAMAMLLGPAGFGLFGLYGSIANLTQSIAGMGVNGSGVRQIAEAAGSGDKVRIGQTTAVLRRRSIVLGLLGAAWKKYTRGMLVHIPKRAPRTLIFARSAMRRMPWIQTAATPTFQRPTALQSSFVGKLLHV